MTPIESQHIFTQSHTLLNGQGRTSVCVTAEVAGPLHESAAGVVAGGDLVETNRADDRCICQCWLGGDDAVGDVVVDRLEMASLANCPEQLL